MTETCDYRYVATISLTARSRCCAVAHDIAEGLVARHFGIAPAPAHASFRIEPDQPLGAFGDAFHDIGAGVEIVAAGIAEHDHGGLWRHRRHEVFFEIDE